MAFTSEGIFQGNTDYLNMCVEYPYTYKEEHVVQTGAAQEGRARVPIDPVTVTITEVSYKFKIGNLSRELWLSDISVDVLPTGDVEVEGIVRAGEIRIRVAPMVCNRGAQWIFPQGHFNINFTLPGPADPKFVLAKLDSDGVLEGAVLKCWIARYHYNDYESEESD
ncbi:hypothetical protein HAX54_052646 [Datura stramonium]|uniref:Uncharacterized protein n=1 Tax=Datura stramonium TaxID=4076 RepID=A0ABS8RRU6_DATST|nr:hypothetical protein [Datura stramonium]